MTTPRTPRRSAWRAPKRVGNVLAVVVGFPLALASMLSLAQCDSDGVTPVCPGEGGDCITPPGTSSASVVITTGGGSGGTTPDGGVSSDLDAALDSQLGQ